MSQLSTINMVQFRKDYNKVKALTKTTHERYILEIFRGMIIENAIRSEVESKIKRSDFGFKWPITQREIDEDGDNHE